MSEPIKRAAELLCAAHDLLRQADQSPVVLDVMSITTRYDDADCDGYCLAADIENWFAEFGITPAAPEHFL